ncbi:MAG: C40 family peptidase [Flavobacteriales bacterium]
MKHFFGLMLFFLSFQTMAQNPAFDHLEMLYDQGYYKLVYRKSARLLDKPEYDFSKLPGYYRSISTLQLAQDAHWRKKHTTSIELAQKTLLSFRETENGQKIIRAHIREISFLKKDLDSWILDGKQGPDFDKNAWKQFVQQFFADLPLIEVDGNNGNVPVVNKPELKERNALVEIAKKQLGVPYLSTGTDPSGFDCSGFTNFVLQQQGQEIPRRAKDQYEACRKLSEEEAQMGDFVFFSNGGEVNHVGILVSEKGQAKTMIHASSSKGISIVEIDSSAYWKPRVKGYGTFISPKK